MRLRHIMTPGGLVTPNRWLMTLSGLVRLGLSEGQALVQALLAYPHFSLYNGGVGAFQTAGGSASADGDPVGQWQDQSGNARHATETTALARPTLSLSGINGKAAMVLDGVDDYFSTVAATLTSYTVYIVATLSESSSYPMLVATNPGASEIRCLSNTRKLEVLKAGAATGASNPTPLVLDQPYLITVEITAGAVERLLINGVEIATDTPASANTAGGMIYIGSRAGSLVWPGKIAHVGITEAADSGETAAINALLMAYYGL